MCGPPPLVDDGSPRRLYLTAAGQVGVELPPGEHRLRLAYHERLLPLGAAITVLTLAACLAVLALTGRRREPRQSAADHNNVRQLSS